MNEDAALLRLTHWLSPVFPVGGYAYSSGLETAIASGWVTDEASLLDWLDRMLAEGPARTDAILLAAAMREDSDGSWVAAWARALAGSAERWQETSEQGRAFARALGDMGVEAGGGAALPVAVGQAARTLGLSARRVVALYLQSYIANLAVGAVRHIPLGQGAGSRVIAALSDRILDVADEAPKLGPESAFSATPGADLAAMLHETQETRIFRT